MGLGTDTFIDFLISPSEGIPRSSEFCTIVDLKATMTINKNRNRIKNVSNRCQPEGAKVLSRKLLQCARHLQPTPA